MKDFNIQVQDSRDHKWHTVSGASFRFQKNHPSDGLNGPLKILGDGIVELEKCYIEEIQFNVW